MASSTQTDRGRRDFHTAKIRQLSIAVTVTALLAACTFDGGNGAPSMDGAPTIDAPPDVTPDAAPIETVCTTNAPDVIACYDFEGTLVDNNGSGHDAVAVPNSVTFVNGALGMAMEFDGAIAGSVAESTDFDPAEITVEAWISPASFPAAGAEMLIWDTQAQYALIVLSGGAVRCVAAGGNGVRIDRSANLMTGSNHYVACTITEDEFRIYVDGDRLGRVDREDNPLVSMEGGQAIGADLDTSGGLANHFDGSMSALRVSSVARSDAEICATAGRALDSCIILD